MTRLAWGNPEQRFFESGVDRGVLYTNNLGVAWNGLISVSESLSGGEPRPAYIDGVKFRNVSSSEEFGASLEAFSAPEEFGPCDGSIAIHNGLFATQQPRRTFGLSYRSRIGNAAEGVEHGYKIHLVYNALASPAARTHSTQSDSTEPGSLTWELTTLPPSLTGHKPTAHFVIDSRYTPKDLLKAVEDILYGSEVAAARLPLPSELVEIFQSPGPVVRTNLLKAPVGPSVTSTAGWRIGTGGIITLVTDELDVTKAIEARDDIGGGGIHVEPPVLFSDGNATGKWFAMGVDVRPMDYESGSGAMHIDIGAYSGASIQNFQKHEVIPYNEYTRISDAVFVTDMSSETDGYLSTLIGLEYSPQRFQDPKILSPEDWVFGDAQVTFGEAGTGADGTTEGSMLVAAGAGQWGRYFLPTSTSAPQNGFAVLPGETVSVKFKARTPTSAPAGSISMYGRFYPASNPDTPSAADAISNTVATTANAWVDITGTFTAPASSDPNEFYYLVLGLYKQAEYTDEVRFSSPGASSQNRFRFRNVVWALAETEEAALKAVSKPLSGDLPPSEGSTYLWAGPANDSISTEQTWNFS